MSLLQMSFAGAVMILAITIIRALAISLLPKKTFLALWGIAVARLLLPFSLPSTFSVYSLIGSQTSGIAATKVPQIDKVLPIDTIGQMATMPGDIGNTTSTVSIWGAVWAAGTLICAMVFVVAYWKCRQEFQTSLPVKNDFIKNWLNAHQLKRPISIRQSSRFSAPLTYGVFRPVILMPISTDWENTKALQYVLAHEYVHIRRFDSITKLVLIAALCVHWFNPLVWVMYILANRDIELSCDEAVVRLFGETTKAAYARALISMEETKSGFAPLCNNFNKNAIEERITAIMKFKKASIFSLALALALVVGVTTAFATSAIATATDNTSNIPSELSCSRLAGRFSQFQSDDLLVQQNIFLLDNPVHVVMPEEVVFELAPLGNFLQEICQGVCLIKSAAQFILHRGGAAVGDDAVHLPACSVQAGPGGLVLLLAGQLLFPPGQVVHPVHRAPKEDMALVCGDFGCVWHGDGRDDESLDWLERRPFTTAFVAGNHENYDALRKYPLEEWRGGIIRRIRPSVILLERGQIFDLGGKQFFTMGGASSHDIQDGILEPDDPLFKKKCKELDARGAMYRVNHLSWWKEELPSKEEYRTARASLACRTLFTASVG